MALPLEAARAAIAKGWAEPQPMARPGYIPETVVMVYGPRDAGELEVVLELLRASHRAAAPRRADDTNDDEKRLP